MNYIKTLKRTTAPTYFNQYIGAMNKNLDNFCLLLRSKGLSDKSVDFSIDSLIPIWHLISKDIINGDIIESPNYKNPPLWTYIELEYIGDEARGYYSEESLWLLDGMAYYIAKVLMNNITDAYWGICDFKVKPKLSHQLKPTLFNVYLWDGYPPLDMTFTHFVRARFEDMRDNLSDDNFYVTVKYIIESTKKNSLEGLLVADDSYLYLA